MAEEAPIEGEDGSGEAVAAKPSRRISITWDAADTKLTDKQRAVARKMFDKHDTNHTGDMDCTELESLLTELNLRLNDELYARYVSSYWDKADDDVSGAINFDEFLLLYQKVVAPAVQFGGKLRTAAGRNDLDTMKDLIQRGCNPNAGDGQGWSCVHHAAEYGHLDAIKLMQELMGMDIDIDAPDRHQWTPLFNAASNGHVEVIRHLAKAGASVNNLSERGRTPLHIAASTGHDDAVRALIQLKAKLNVQDDAGWTPLHQACMHSHRGCIRALLEAKADRTVNDMLGYTMMKYTTDDIEKFINGTQPSHTADSKGVVASLTPEVWEVIQTWCMNKGGEQRRLAVDVGSNNFNVQNGAVV